MISPHSSSALRTASRWAREAGPWAEILLLVAGAIVIIAVAARDGAEKLALWAKTAKGEDEKGEDEKEGMNVPD